MASLRVRAFGLICVAVGSQYLAACGGGGSHANGDPTPTPVTADTPTPAPTSSSTPFPGVAGCNLPPVTEAAKKCDEVDNHPELSGTFNTEVDDSVNAVRATHPDIFAGDGGIKDFGAFRVAVVKELESRHLCVVVDGEELAIKNTNDFNDQYHVELSNRQVRIGPGAFRARCYPANFPVNPTPLPQRADCNLPSSREFACTRLENPQFLDVVSKVQNDIRVERPDLTDGQNVLVKQDEYYAEVIKRIRAMGGYCAIFDGEELALKNNNDYNEQYHLVLSNGMLHPGNDKYRSTCEPAAF
jgi:hypothetical protein